jgi:quinol monooxygenase YgiN
MILSITTITTRAGKRDEFLKKADSVRAELRQMRGCRDLQILVDHPSLLQSLSAHRPDVVTVLRKWDNEQYVANSFGDKALLDFAAENRDLVDKVEHRFFEIV